MRALVAVYAERAGGGPGRKPVETVDLLRASVVFLHATLEDSLRSTLTWRWPLTNSIDDLEEVPLPGERKTRFALGELLRHRGATVDDLIRASIEDHLERSNFNDVGEVKTALRRAGIDPKIVVPYATELAAMMSRRHFIVHRADRHDPGGSGHHGATSLSQGTVEAWIDTVEKVCKAVVAAL